MSVIHDIMSDLHHNLNYRDGKHDWRRLEANPDRPNCVAADRHFYEQIFSPARLRALSEETGYTYPNWGDQVGATRVGVYPDDHKTRPGQHLSVGLRWNWDTSSGNRGREKGLWRPQIVVTIRPLAIFNKFNRFKTKKRANDQQGERFAVSKIEALPEWKAKGLFEIIPLQVILIHTAFTPLGDQRLGLEANQSSRHHPEQRANSTILDDDEKQRDLLEQIGREAFQVWQAANKGGIYGVKQ